MHYIETFVDQLSILIEHNKYSKSAAALEIITKFKKLIANTSDEQKEVIIELVQTAPDHFASILTSENVLTDRDMSIFADYLCRIIICAFMGSTEPLPIKDFADYLIPRLSNNTFLFLELIIGVKEVLNVKQETLIKKSQLFSHHLETLEKQLESIAQKTKEQLRSELQITTKDITSKKEQLSTKLDNEKITAQEILKKYEQISNAALNNLASSFATFSNNKREEMDKWQTYTKRIGLAAVAIAFLAIFFHPATGIITAWDEAKAAKDVITAFFSSNLVYFLVIEALVIYFFRICLNNFYAARDELLQLEIREALCKFAPTYTAFAEADDTRLDNFTKHIFSPLASKMNPTPHPLDFLGQVCNVVNNGKKK